MTTAPKCHPSKFFLRGKRHAMWLKTITPSTTAAQYDKQKSNTQRVPLDHDDRQETNTVRAQSNDTHCDNNLNIAAKLVGTSEGKCPLTA